MYASGETAISKLGIGTSGQMLTSTGAAPQWQDVSTVLDGTYFKQGGNSFGATATLGTNDNQSIAFETNNTTRTIISNSGDFTHTLGDNAGATAFTVKDSDSSNLFSVDSLGALVHSGTTASFSLDGGGSGDAFTITNTGTGLSFRVNDTSSDTSPFVIDASGNMGIGTTSPTARLTIQGIGGTPLLHWINSAGNTVGTISEGYAEVNSPTSFSAYGNTTVNGNLNFANMDYSKITSAGDLYITTGSAFRDSNIYLDPQGSGEVFVTTNLLVDGDVEASGSFVSDAGFDLAETYNTTDETLEPGDLVMVTEEMLVQRAEFTNRDQLIGIISTKPGFTLGGGVFGSKVEEPTEEQIKEYQVLVALAGRVPVKVSLDNGEIRPGDALTIGLDAGKAVKATDSGMIVARALEAFTAEKEATGQTTIIAMVQTTWWQDTIQGSLALNWDTTDSTVEYLQNADTTITGTQTTEGDSSNVLGTSTFYNVNVTGDLMVGLMKVDSLNNSIGVVGVACYDTRTDSINQNLCNSQALYIQKELAGGVDIFNGKITFNPNGTVKATKIQADVVEAKEFRATGNTGATTIKAGTTEIWVPLSTAKADSKVFLTPKSPVAIGVKEIKSGEGFTLQIDRALGKDLQIDWWLIN